MRRQNGGGGLRWGSAAVAQARQLLREPHGTAEGPTPRAVFVGGLRWGWRTVYWPLVELRVYANGLEVRPHPTWVQLLDLPGRLFGGRIPTARFSLSDLVQVEEQATRLRLVPVPPARPLTFITYSPALIVRALREAGAPATLITKATFRWLGRLH